MLDARKRTRRATVPPAASMVRCHASLRETRATIWSRTVSSSTHQAALASAVSNSSRRPARASTSAPAVISDPAIVIAVRWRRPKARMVAPTGVYGVRRPSNFAWRLAAAALRIAARSRS